jgi:hypothetical protein
MMEAPDELGLFIREADDGDASQGGFGEVESAVVVLPQEGGEPLLALRRRQVPPVELLPGQLDVAAHDLQRLLAALPDELGPQDRVPFQHPAPGLVPGGRVQRAGQGRDVLIEIDLPFFPAEQQVEKHSLLGGRERVDVFDDRLAHDSPFLVQFD